MPDYSVRVGDADIISVSDGHIHFAPSDFFPSVESSEWEPYSDQLTEDGLIRMNVGSFLIRVGDAAHVPPQAHHTDWSPRADTDPQLSARNRAELFDRMEKDHSLVISGHFPVPGFGKLARVEGRRYWQPL